MSSTRVVVEHTRWSVRDVADLRRPSSAASPLARVCATCAPNCYSASPGSVTSDICPRPRPGDFRCRAQADDGRRCRREVPLVARRLRVVLVYVQQRQIQRTREVVELVIDGVWCPRQPEPLFQAASRAHRNRDARADSSWDWARRRLKTRRDRRATRSAHRLHILRFGLCVSRNSSNALDSWSSHPGPRLLAR